MKTKLLTLVLFSILTLTFTSCSDEEVAPSPSIELDHSSSTSIGDPALDRDC